MASGKKSREQRRLAAQAPPPVRSKGTPVRRQANPKVLAIVGAVVVVVVVGVVLGFVLSGGSSNGVPKNVRTLGSAADGLPGATDVQTIFKGIPQKGLFLGSPFAPVQMVMYIDLQCPICQNFETTITPELISKYIRTGKVRLEIKPWAFIGPDSTRGQKAMLAAAAQNKAFEFSQVLYDNQGTENTGWLSDSMIVQIAESVSGMNVPEAPHRPELVHGEAADRRRRHGRGREQGDGHADRLRRQERHEAEARRLARRRARHLAGRARARHRDRRLVRK